MKQKKNFLNNALVKFNNALVKFGTAMEDKKKKFRVCSCYLITVLMSAPLTVFADEEAEEAGAVVIDANASWNAVMNFLLTWIPRLGAVLLFIGGVEFAIAYKNEDANSKTNATRLMVSGAMVIAIPIALKSLLMA